MSKDLDSALVSIGVPFYNSEKFLGFAITSVINQSYSNWELLLMDDGSSDNSVKVAQSFEKLDNRIKVFHDGTNKGLPARLNELSQLSKGEFYVRMDADDIMHPQRIFRQIEFLKAHSKVDLVGTGLISIDNNNNILGIRGNNQKEEYTIGDMIAGHWSVHPTIAGRTSWFKKNNYDTSLKRAQDFDLWIRTINQSNFAKISCPYLYYREASTSSLKKYRASTKYAIKIYWKNKKVIGTLKCIKLTLTKFLKLFVYLIGSMFNSTDKIIKRRYNEISKESVKEHQNTLETAIELKIKAEGQES
ncbi:glycosyltransferase family 2 protein [Flagellimonas sp. 389]|uniref:glycosyltransferase family 2 protein n=1 Tax=Flagellimonas sp. 389 TaxID=2835862 RepID=UPI001BD55CC3|nr:glycosyltransferase family A protein [Flagellimonas sp. 389]MBS9462201.1 glycosyltransferase family 2 protein [Flagellimonas sp. 389]